MKRGKRCTRRSSDLTARLSIPLIKIAQKLDLGQTGFKTHGSLELRNDVFTALRGKVPLLSCSFQLVLQKSALFVRSMVGVCQLPPQLQLVPDLHVPKLPLHHHQVLY